MNAFFDTPSGAAPDVSSSAPSSGDPGFPAGEAASRVLADILAPLAPDEPCGPPARFDPVFTEIRLLREEDDPALPMGQWERPLRQADWAQVEARCVDMLGTRCKHLQVAAWLLEAWMRQHGFAGLAQGLRMLDALLRRYWAGLHPLIEEDGDCDLRLAPLEWLNESLGAAVRVHAALLPLEQCRPPFLTLAGWERMTARDLAGEHPKANDAAEVPLARADIAAIAARSPAGLRTTRRAVAQCLESLAAIDGFLRQQLGAGAPNLVRLHATLEAARRVLVQLASPDAADMQEPVALEPAAADAAAVAGQPAALLATLPATLPAGLPAAPAIATAGWRNRAEAYATLDALAAYLMEVEPHSPVPFLVRRALHWGSMPLPELIAEILREEGDLNRLVGVLGLKM